MCDLILVMNFRPLIFVLFVFFPSVDLRLLMGVNFRVLFSDFRYSMPPCAFVCAKTGVVMKSKSKKHSLPRSQMESPSIDRHLIISAAMVATLTSYSRGHVYRLARAGRFPTPIQLGPGRVGWLDHEVRAWIDRRQSERNSPFAEDPRPSK